jgi:hypothetical protein
MANRMRRFALAGLLALGALFLPGCATAPI